MGKIHAEEIAGPQSFKEQNNTQQSLETVCALLSFLLSLFLKHIYMETRSLFL